MSLVTLDVGGTKFVTNKDTLTNNSAYFSALLGGNFSEKEEYFIDRDPTNFRHILAYFRDPQHKIPRSIHYELDYYGIEYEYDETPNFESVEEEPLRAPLETTDDRERFQFLQNSVMGVLSVHSNKNSNFEMKFIQNLKTPFTVPIECDFTHNRIVLVPKREPKTSLVHSFTLQKSIDIVCGAWLNIEFADNGIEEFELLRYKIIDEIWFMCNGMKYFSLSGKYIHFVNNATKSTRLMKYDEERDQHHSQMIVYLPFFFNNYGKDVRMILAKAFYATYGNEQWTIDVKLNGIKNLTIEKVNFILDGGYIGRDVREKLFNEYENEQMVQFTKNISKYEIVGQPNDHDVSFRKRIDDVTDQIYFAFEHNGKYIPFSTFTMVVSNHIYSDFTICEIEERMRRLGLYCKNNIFSLNVPGCLSLCDMYDFEFQVVFPRKYEENIKLILFVEDIKHIVYQKHGPPCFMRN